MRIFSYLPNPRVWKALIAAELCGVEVGAAATVRLAPPAAVGAAAVGAAVRLGRPVQALALMATGLPARRRRHRPPDQQLAR